jgi:hypothetical protein
MQIPEILNILEQSFIATNYLRWINICSEDDDLLLALGLDEDLVENLDAVFTQEDLYDIKKFMQQKDLVKLTGLYFSLKDRIDSEIGDLETLYDTVVSRDIYYNPSAILLQILGSKLMKDLGVKYVRNVGSGAEKSAFLINEDFIIKAPLYISDRENAVSEEAEKYRWSRAVRKYLPKVYGTSKFGVYSAIEYIEGEPGGLWGVLKDSDLEISLPQVSLEISEISLYHALIYAAQGLSFMDSHYQSGLEYEYAKLSIPLIKQKMSDNINSSVDYIKSSLEDEADSQNTVYDFINEMGYAFEVSGARPGHIEDLDFLLEIVEHHRTIAKKISELNGTPKEEWVLEHIKLIENGSDLLALTIAFLIRTIFENEVLTALYEFMSTEFSTLYDDTYRDLDAFFHNLIFTDPSKYETPFKIIDFGGFERGIYA